MQNKRILIFGVILGYTFEELLEKSKKDKSLEELLLNIDILVDR